MKFGRTYNLTVQGVEETHIIGFPLTLDFDVLRNILASANTGRFTLYNLRESVRRDLFHDRYDTLTYKQIKLAAGYVKEPSLPVIFQGNVLSAYSYRSGPDWYTEIEAFDGGFGMINGDTKLQLSSGWNLQDVIRNLIGGMPNVIPGAVGNFDAPNNRGVSFAGNPWDIIQGLAPDAHTFVDKEIANVISKDQFIDFQDGISVLNSRTGLLGTPRRHNALIDVPMLFEPRAVVGQQVLLESLEKVNNGTYQIIGIHHKALISGAVAGDARTDLSLWLGTQRLTGVPAGVQ